MQAIRIPVLVFTIAGLFGLAGPAARPSLADEPLRVCFSNQIYHSFGNEVVTTFTRLTGIVVDMRTGSSDSCTYRLMNGHSDIAAIARALDHRHTAYGYVQMPICKDPLAVIVHRGCGIDDLSASQVQDIFAGEVSNWNTVGGPDLPVVVIVPGKQTAAHKNFRRQFMTHKEMDHDFMSYDSTMVIAAIRHFPCGAVSFVSNGAAVSDEELSAVRIDGRAPTDPDYPYFQIHYFVTRGQPRGFEVELIDFTYSDNGRAIMTDRGVVPLTRR